MKNEELGKYGGRVIRGFSGDVPYIRGATLEPDMVKDWPAANKAALQASGKVEWFDRPNKTALKALVDDKKVSVSSDE